MSDENKDELIEKQKISRFAEPGVPDTDSAEYSDDRETSHRSDLTEMYPEPKTYYQRKRASERRIERYKRKLPPYPRLSVAFWGSVFLAAMILILQRLEQMWTSATQGGGQGMSGVAMSTVFLVFAIWLALCFLIIRWVRYTSSTLYILGMSRVAFWIIYVTFVLIMAGVWASGWIAKPTESFWPYILGGLNFIFIFLYLKLFSDTHDNPTDL